MQPYLYLGKMRILRALAYRFDVVSTILVQSIIMIATSYFWIAVYGAKDVAVGTSKTQMITYMILSTVLSCFFTIGVEDRVKRSVRTGNVATDMLKPINMFGMYLAEDIGGIVVALFLNIIPILIVACIFIQVPAFASWFHFLLFLISSTFSYTINWLFTACFSMIAFWTISINPLSYIKSILIRVLSGSVVPLWFFPDWLQSVLRFLPFMYMYQLPLSIYIGKLTAQETVIQMGIQLFWVVALYGIYKLMSKTVSSKVMVQGG